MGLILLKSNSWLEGQRWDTGQHDTMGLSTEGMTAVSPSALGLLAFRPSPSCFYCASLYLLTSSFLFREFCLERLKITDLPCLFYTALKSQWVSGEEGSY